MYFHYNPQSPCFSAKSGRHWHQDGAGPSGGGRRGPWASQGAVARGHDALEVLGVLGENLGELAIYRGFSLWLFNIAMENNAF